MLPQNIEIGLNETAITIPPGATFPNGCHVCEVEIERETGVVELVKFTGEDYITLPSYREAVLYQPPF